MIQKEMRMRAMRLLPGPNPEARIAVQMPQYELTVGLISRFLVVYDYPLPPHISQERNYTEASGYMKFRHF